jgi:hypothetical protein
MQKYRHLFVMVIRGNARREIKCSSTLQFVVKIIYNGIYDLANKRKKVPLK